MAGESNTGARAEPEGFRDLTHGFLVPVSVKARCRRAEQSEEHQRDCESAEHTCHSLSFEEQRDARGHRTRPLHVKGTEELER
jgi:hypothetical protein